LEVWVTLGISKKYVNLIKACYGKTYKLLDLRLSVYVLMTEDGYGQSEIAAISE